MSASRLEAAEDIKKILSSVKPPRAIFATTDEQASAALRAARELGLRVPEDLAIIGYDGVSEARLGSVSITTIQVPLRALAVRAFNALEQPNDDWHLPQLLSGRLHLGETCGSVLKRVSKSPF